MDPMVKLQNDNDMIYFIGGYMEYFACINKNHTYLINTLTKYGCVMSMNEYLPTNVKNKIKNDVNTINFESCIIIKMFNSNINTMMMETNILNNYTIIKYISEHEQYCFTTEKKSLVTLYCLGIGFELVNGEIIRTTDILESNEKLAKNNKEKRRGDVIYYKADITKYFTVTSKSTSKSILKSKSNKTKSQIIKSSFDNEIIMYITI